MKELSVFVDESGDFGAYDHHAPYYLVTLVFHDQSANILPDIQRLQSIMRDCGITENTVHTGPLIRRESEYRNLSVLERRKIFNFLFNFVRAIDVTYETVVVEKKQLSDERDLNAQLSKQIGAFLRSRLEALSAYDKVIVYYDKGQAELTRILVSVFNAILQNVEFRTVIPADYKLFQAADMLCTLELLSLKYAAKASTNSERLFFPSDRNFRKNFIRPMSKKRF